MTRHRDAGGIARRCPRDSSRALPDIPAVVEGSRAGGDDVDFLAVVLSDVGDVKTARSRRRTRIARDCGGRRPRSRDACRPDRRTGCREGSCRATSSRRCAGSCRGGCRDPARFRADRRRRHRHRYRRKACRRCRIAVDPRCGFANMRWGTVRTRTAVDSTPDGGERPPIRRKRETFDGNVAGGDP